MTSSNSEEDSSSESGFDCHEPAITATIRLKRSSTGSLASQNVSKRLILDEIRSSLKSVENLSPGGVGRSARGGDYEKNEEIEGSSGEIFEKLCTIGKGSFGQVLLCRGKHDKKYYAMKTMQIAEVVSSQQIQHVHSEKRLLQQISHPFVVKLHEAWHDSSHIYLLFDYIPGGELFSYLLTYGRFTISTARFYAAEICVALDYLHSNKIIYRDLKPENVLLHKDGHVVLTDFGFAKELKDRTWTLCGTPEYLAPEVIECRGHNSAVDWWALGVFIFEMLAGYPPFKGDNMKETYAQVIAANPKYPKHFDETVKDLVKKMLVKDRTKRLGAMKNGSLDIRGHEWFAPILWNDIARRRIKPPIVPAVSYDGDPRNYNVVRSTSSDYIQPATPEDLKLFELW